jgi:hypothetical protein
VRARFERLRSQDLRVATVSYRLATANRALCGRVLTAQAGFVLHGIEQYGLSDRTDAARSFGLDGHVGVMAVVAGSPAEAAGLRAGDRILSVNGRAIAPASADAPPSRAAVALTQQLLLAEMQRGEVTLGVAGAAGLREVRFQAETGCPSQVELIAGDAVNAWADGARIMVSDGLLRRCASDADLAAVIGHELAHNLLHHRGRLAAHGISADRVTDLSTAALREMQATEEEADRFGVRLAAAASYDLSNAASFMSGLLDGAVATTHPSAGRRLQLLRAAIAVAGRRGSAVRVQQVS